MAIDEIVDEETLGGAAMHSTVSGLSDYLAVDEADAIRTVRDIVKHLRWQKLGPGPTEPADDPRYDPAELAGIAPADVKVPVEIREILARVLDGSRLEEFKPLYGDKLVCGWGSICGFPVGVLANNGILFSEESAKGAQFIQLCNKTSTPLVFVQNITGFMVGSAAERGGIIRNGAQADQRRVELRGAALRAHGRRQLRGRQLTACRAGPTTPGSSSPGPTTGSP